VWISSNGVRIFEHLILGEYEDQWVVLDSGYSEANQNGVFLYQSFCSNVPIEASQQHKKVLFQPSSKSSTAKLFTLMQPNSEPSKTFSDITITLDNDHYNLHRCILASQSEYFAALFTNGMLESKQPVIALKDVSKEVFDLIVEFLYTGDIKSDVSWSVELLMAASRFQITDLEELCISRMTIDETNVLQLLNVTSSPSVTDACVNYIRDTQLFKDDAFIRELIAHYPEILIRCLKVTKK
jgi:hypothetical protein